MQIQQVPLVAGSHTVGRIEFPRPSSLEAWRTLDGLALVVPSRIVLDGHKDLDGIPVLSGIHATISLNGLEVGVAEDKRVYRTLTQEAGRLVARLSSSTVRSIERLRDGDAVKLKLSVGGELCVARGGHSVGGMVRSDPMTLADPHYREPTVDVEYDSVAWSDMLHATGFGENVVVEIPLPPSPGPPWDEVWKALRAARDALNRGGSMAWKTAVSEFRVALEKWEKIDGQAVDHGEGGLTANRDQRAARTVNQRRDALRWHAHQLAHYFQHNHADECTRDDAVLVLATLAALLAVRKP